MVHKALILVCIVLLLANCVSPVRPVPAPEPMTTLDSAKVYADSLAAVLDTKQRKAEEQVRLSIGIVVIAIGLVWWQSQKR